MFALNRARAVAELSNVMNSDAFDSDDMHDFLTSLNEDGITDSFVLSDPDNAQFLNMLLQHAQENNFITKSSDRYELHFTWNANDDYDTYYFWKISASSPSLSSPLHVCTPPHGFNELDADGTGVNGILAFFEAAIKAGNDLIADLNAYADDNASYPTAG